MPTLGGEYFFLHERHRAHRPAGHEREDALAYFRKLDAIAFVKPLLGSRGDFAQAIHGEAALLRYLGEVSQLLRFDPDPAGRSPASNTGFSCSTTRCFITARKYPPFVPGDGMRTIRDLLIAHNAALQSRGLSPAVTMERDTSLDIVLPKGERWEIPGRMNLSAGGTMVLEAPRSGGR